MSDYYELNGKFEHIIFIYNGMKSNNLLNKNAYFASQYKSYRIIISYYDKHAISLGLLSI